MRVPTWLISLAILFAVDIGRASSPASEEPTAPASVKDETPASQPPEAPPPQQSKEPALPPAPPMRIDIGGRSDDPPEASEPPEKTKQTTTSTRPKAPVRSTEADVEPPNLQVPQLDKQLYENSTTDLELLHEVIDKSDSYLASVDPSEGAYFDAASNLTGLDRTRVRTAINEAENIVLEPFRYNDAMSSVSAHIGGYFDQARGMLQRVSLDGCSSCVTVVSTENAIASIRTNHTRMRKLKSLLRVIKVTSIPEGASAQLFVYNIPEPRYSAYTTGYFGHVYLGAYRLVVTLDGYGDFRGSIDLFDHSGDTVACALVPEPETRNRSICRHKM